MTEKPCDNKITIIVPVYNEESRLISCVESLLSQTCKDIEILLVDDGSEDGSRELISSLAEKYENIQKLFLSHGEPMRARLQGVKQASSKWIGFADADDDMDSTMYESLLSAALKHDADLVLCGYHQHYPEGRTYTYKSSVSEVLLDRSKAMNMLLCGDHVEMWGPCTKLFRRRLFSEDLIAELSEVTIHHFEDLLMNYYILKKAANIVSIPQCPYHYRIRYDSTSYIGSYRDACMDGLAIREIILEDADESLRPIAKSFFLKSCTSLYSYLRARYPSNHKYCQEVLDLILKHR
ncbi:MAG: glycosyltransferase family 2 protein [Mogibacterium sp.]|nr:glycosyltransferase family 2 protein [Mogibacterium sp.]